MILLKRVGARRFNSLLEKLGSDESSDPLEIAPGVWVTIPLASLDPVAAGAQSKTGTVNIGSTQLFNPANSTVDLELVDVTAAVNTADNILFGFHNTALTETATEVWLDGRQVGTPQGQCFANDIAGVGNIFEFQDVLANSPVHSIMAPHIVLTPGEGFIVRCETTGFLIRVSYVWRERTIRP